MNTPPISIRRRYTLYMQIKPCGQRIEGYIQHIRARCSRSKSINNLSVSTQRSGKTNLYEMYLQDADIMRHYIIQQSPGRPSLRESTCIMYHGASAKMQYFMCNILFVVGVKSRGLVKWDLDIVRIGIYCFSTGVNSLHCNRTRIVDKGIYAYLLQQIL